MPKKTHHCTTITVTGKGDFPMDMLRHDLASPVSGDDVRKIERPIEPTIEYYREHRTVRLNVFTHVPTEGRWASFGWPITSID